MSGVIYLNEATAMVCGWCGKPTRWGVPEDDAAHKHGVCVGREPPDDAEAIPSAGRVAVLTLRFNDDVPGEEIRRLSRAWSAKISEKLVVASVHVNTYGTLGS